MKPIFKKKKQILINETEKKILKKKEGTHASL